MIRTKTIQGYYGSQKVPCYIFVAEVRGVAYYAVEGSILVNGTFIGEQLVDGCDVEGMTDCDTFQADAEVNSEEDLEREVEDYLS